MNSYYSIYARYKTGEDVFWAEKKSLMLAQDRGLSTAQDQTLLYITSNNIIPLDYELSIAWEKMYTHYLSLILSVLRSIDNLLYCAFFLRSYEIHSHTLHWHSETVSCFLDIFTSLRMLRAM